jgi:hypothetical protein
MASIYTGILNKGIYVLFCSLLIPNQFVKAQCVASGPRNPGSSTSASYAGSDFAFSNSSNTLLSDNNRAVASSLALLLSGQTENLQVTNFGFSIPPTAIICGIQADIEKMADDIGIIPFVGVAYIRDLSVKIIKNGTAIDSNAAKAANWSGTEGYSIYGGSTSLWGTTWSVADINASNFGLSFSASINGLVGLMPEVLIDNIRITVYYYEPPLLTIAFQQFEVAEDNNHTAQLTWTSNEFISTERFIIQRSADKSHWESLSGLPHHHAGTGRYSFTDARPLPARSYYRIAMTWPLGKTTYSASKSLLMPVRSQVHCYPNPFTDLIVLTGVQPGQQVLLTDLFGRLVEIWPASINSSNIKLDVSQIKPGVYIVLVGDRKIKMVKR